MPMNGTMALMVRIVASAELEMPRDRASTTILHPRAIEKWMVNARGVKADANWPFFNTSLSWETDHGTGICSARVVDNNLPEFLKVEVSTPSHSRVVTHRFTALEGDRTRYERVVDVELRGIRRLLGPLGAVWLRRQIWEEVRRAAALASAVPPTPLVTTPARKKA
jgi:hypothetical protein